MKTICWGGIGWLCLLTSSLSYAVPPYIGVSVIENAALSDTACIKIAKQVLQQEGFAKIRLYPNNPTLFAAYREATRYGYKVVIRCAQANNTVTIVAVSETPLKARQKAEQLRDLMNANNNDVHPPTQPKYRIDAENELDSPHVGNAWQRSTLTQRQCLSRAELSLRNSGFSMGFQVDNDGVHGNNANYSGIIRCLSQEQLILFIVAGEDTRLVKQLLRTLQTNF